MQGGAPSHITTEVKQLQKKTFTDVRGLSRLFIHECPTRPPDLTTVEFWLWVYEKSRVIAIAHLLWWRVEGCYSP
ncbi:hypothetical protein TNCV_1165541 [Trichonephila clavipes]|uniref:Uncharacterized protein n=1 Tax=Trichonephila clavipes TaxID=2585209 RepID=A0A8X6T070_TRICX|nr:hypothetical protein TNCV_1165541 [Trichonephila clavipes]